MTAQKKKTRARPWRWTPAPGDPDAAALKAAVRKELRETKAAQMPGPRSIADLAVCLGVPVSTLHQRLDGRRPLSWADAHAIAEAVGVAVPPAVGAPPHHGSRSGPSTTG